METAIVNDCIRLVQRLGYKIDKEHLIEAIKNDKKQYYEGFKDAYIEIEEEIKRFKNKEANSYGCGCIESVADALYDLEDWINYKIDTM